jgi:VanZ family protein
MFESAMPREGPTQIPPFFLPAALVYLVFVIYGSLVPLLYVPIPLSEAWHKFQQIPYLDLGVQSRADWVANIVLFVPLSFLWTGILSATGGVARRVFGTAFVLAACVGLSLAIEFTQLFFPQRTVSMNDLIAESLGAGIGIAAWWLAGAACTRWLRRWRDARGMTSTATSLLWIYLAVVFLYNVMPLDLILSPVEIYHKLTVGRIVLIPFGGMPADLGLALYGLGTDVLVWVAPAALWMIAGRSRRGAWASTVMAAASIEAFQLFVYTRVSDVTDVITAAMGAGIGVWLGGTFVRGAVDAPERSSSPTRAARERPWERWGAVAFALWAIGVCVASWYPFDIVLERTFIVERLHRLAPEPFTTYYFQSEYTALSTAMRKFIFFFPGGVALAVMLLRFTAPRARWVAAIGATTVILGAASAVELVQVLVPSKFPDSTDLLIETAGGAAGYGIAVMIWNRLGPTSGAR